MVKHMNDKPIIIIGAGISGLTLCLILIKNGYPAILFEKEKEIDQRMVQYKPEWKCSSFSIRYQRKNYYYC